MPYVTEQLQFNLNKIHEVPNNQATLRQPAPLVLSQYDKQYLSSAASMEMAVTLAKRDIRLRNIPKHDDLDTIPVKEISKPHKFKMVPKIPTGIEIPCQLRMNSAPAKPIPKQSKNTHIVCMPTTEPTVTTNHSNTQTERNSVIMMIKALTDIKNRLAWSNNKKFFPDPIEEARLTRRAEEQRRHLYRVLYNAKRHTVQLVAFLQRTAFKHRHTVLKQSNIICHLLAAHRSLMSALGSFLKGAEMLKSPFMQDLRKKVSTEIELLLEEFAKVANLLEIKSQTFTTQARASVPDQDNGVPHLKILDIRKSHKDPPLSPERDESLRAAVRSLVKTALIKRNSPCIFQTPELEADTSKPQQKTFRMNKAMPCTISSKKSAVKPKSNIKKSITKKKRPTTAAPTSHKIRSLGNVKKSHVSERPCSAPLLGNGRYVSQCDMPLMIRGGQLTPYITERELARQAWLDKLTEEQPPISADISLDSDLLRNSGPLSSREDLEPKHAPVITKKFNKQSAFKAVAEGAEMNTTMVQLLDKLEEIEKEEDEIRNRWLHIQYSDPYQNDKVSYPPVVLPSAELLACSSVLIDQGPTIYSDHCKDSGPADISLTPEGINSIQSYRKATKRHLILTRHSKTAEFDPWATINLIVDNLVEKLVNDVCGELLQTCDGLAENLYMAEFLPAGDQSQAKINVT